MFFQIIVQHWYNIDTDESSDGHASDDSERKRFLNIIAPCPMKKTEGAKARIVVMVVIKIGFKRRFPATCKAGISGMPPLRKLVDGVLLFNMESLIIIPVMMMIPIMDIIFMLESNSQRNSSAPKKINRHFKQHNKEEFQ
ncbi:MAG: hypothetical protein U5K79_05890 [Cyclobacteriaceae bacterium]|nr:hypothetical protein [Cyclobacteriaceae bacterium]